MVSSIIFWVTVFTVVAALTLILIGAVACTEFSKNKTNSPCYTCEYQDECEDGYFYTDEECPDYIEIEDDIL